MLPGISAGKKKLYYECLKMCKAAIGAPAKNGVKRIQTRGRGRLKGIKGVINLIKKLSNKREETIEVSKCKRFFKLI